MSSLEILFVFGSVIGGFVFIIFLLKNQKGMSVEAAERERIELLNDVKEQREVLIRDAKERVKIAEERAQQNIDLLSRQIRRDEEHLEGKEKELSLKEAENKKVEDSYSSLRSEVLEEKKLIKAIEKEMVGKLLSKTGKSEDDVKSEIINEIENGLEYEADILVKKTEENLREDLEKNAKRAITDAIQKYVKESSVEKKYAVIAVPRDSMKGVIVGKDAKNVLYFEEKTETRVIFNDAPNTIIVSHYNLFRQEIACLAMKKLLKQKVVNEEVIDKALEAAERDVDSQLLEIGREAAKRLELKGYPDEFLKLIGRLRFRTSFGQNILSHSFEVAAFGRMLASEIGQDIREAELACFFHDIGKAIDQDVNRPHDILSKEILEEYGFPEPIVYAAHAHHDAVPPKNPVDFLVKAADAISAGRPGARQETLEKYLEKIRALEGIALSKKGVDKAYAISAGREVRVFVDPKKVKDDLAMGVAKDIAREVEEEVIYPGKIKINVIRRTEAVDYANKKKSGKK